MAARLKHVAQTTVAKLFGLHSTLTKTQTEIQRTYTGLGAEFGQPITAANVAFALKREPVAHRIVFAVARVLPCGGKLENSVCVLVLGPHGASVEA